MTCSVRRGAAGAAILFAGCLLLAACSNGGASNSASASSGSVPSGGQAAFGRAGDAVAGPAVRTVGQAARATADLRPASQSIIYTATIKLRSAEVAAAAKRAIGIVVAAGGYTAGEHLVTAKRAKTGQSAALTLKVPVAAYQAVLQRLSSPALGTELGLQQRATNVTQQVADVNSLVTSEQDAIAALRGLLRRAASVSGLLAVQRQISNDESDLNSLQAQQRALDRQTSYATISMTLVSRAHRSGAAARHGFGAGLTAGWRSFRQAVVWVLTALGAALPFLLVAAVLGGLGYAGRRRLRRRASA